MSPYRRVLLKLSGESLGSDKKAAIDPKKVAAFALEIAENSKRGFQLGVVLGGGNWLRGNQSDKLGMMRVTADRMGMLATVMNALAMRDALGAHDIDCRILSPTVLTGISQSFEPTQAKRYLKAGKVLLFAGGTGNPFVSTDSAAALRALEIEAEILLKGTAVEGVFDSDPRLNKEALPYEYLSYDQVIDRELAVMDLSAFILCRDHSLPIRVFDFQKRGSLTRIMEGQQIGTLVTNQH